MLSEQHSKVELLLSFIGKLVLLAKNSKSCGPSTFGVAFWAYLDGSKLKKDDLYT